MDLAPSNAVSLFGDSVLGGVTGCAAAPPAARLHRVAPHLGSDSIFIHLENIFRTLAIFSIQSQLPRIAPKTYSARHHFLKRVPRFLVRSLGEIENPIHSFQFGTFDLQRFPQYT